MDAPNAPNPTNPNAQDQFVDAVQGHTNPAQGPTNQNQVQVPAVQNQAQGPAVQIQVQGPAQVGQIYLSSHHNNQPQYNWSLLVL